MTLSVFKIFADHFQLENRSQIEPHLEKIDQHLEENKEVVIGVVTGLFMYPICTYIATFAEKWLRENGKAIVYPGDDIIKLFEGFDSLQGNAFMTVLRIAGKIALMTFLDVVEPVVKEAIFRGWIHDQTRSLQEWIWAPGADSIAQKIARIVIGGVVFGTYHLSPFQGWANIPIFVATTSAGMILGALKEWRGSSTSNVTAHIVHNVIAMAVLFA